MENTILVNNWLDMSVNQFYEYTKIIAKYEDDIDLNLNLYSLFSGIGVDELEATPYYKLQAKLAKMAWVNSKMPKVKVGDIEIKGVLFRPATISELTTSEYLDFIEYSKMPDNIHLILSLFLKPVNKVRRGLNVRYENLDYTRDEVAAMILDDLSIVYANSYLVFFSLVLNKSIKLLTQTLRTKMTHLKIKMKVRSLLGLKEVDGSGLNALTMLLKQLEELGNKSTV